MFDIHSHIIYGVDDGSQNEAGSLQLLEQARDCGTRHIFATPHVLELNNRPSWSLIRERAQQLKALVPTNASLNIYPGAEVEMSWDILAAYEEEPGAYCLNGSRYALVELPMFEIPSRAEDFWFELQLKGVTPVLAHPERYPALWRNPERLLSWLKKGMLLQINGGSLNGRFGELAQQNAELLLANHLVSFIGSDAHNQRRNTDLTQARQRLAELTNPEEYKAITELNGNLLLKNEEIGINVPSKLYKPKEKKSFWSRIFG